uniref:Uncharacterized protein n=1 Tax=Arundo donax TaxID=35708 RepID=A0A0A9G668_ARUDO
MCMVLCFQRFGVNRTACADRTGGEEQMTETARGREKELHRSQEVALGGVVSLLNLQDTCAGFICLLRETTTG